MNGKIERRGRPLGSGDKNKVILGIRVNEEEYNIIKKGLSRLKNSYKTNAEVVLYLFNKYEKIEIEKKIKKKNKKV